MTWGRRRERVGWWGGRERREVRGVRVRVGQSWPWWVASVWESSRSTIGASISIFVRLSSSSSAGFEFFGLRVTLSCEFELARPFDFESGSVFVQRAGACRSPLPRFFAQSDIGLACFSFSTAPGVCIVAFNAGRRYMVFQGSLGPFSCTGMFRVYNAPIFLWRTRREPLAACTG